MHRKKQTGEWTTPMNAMYNVQHALGVQCRMWYADMMCNTCATCNVICLQCANREKQTGEPWMQM